MKPRNNQDLINNKFEDIEWNFLSNTEEREIEQSIMKRNNDLLKFQMFFANEIEQMEKNQKHNTKIRKLCKELSLKLRVFKKEFLNQQFDCFIKGIKQQFYKNISQLSKKFMEIIQSKDQEIKLLKSKQIEMMKNHKQILNDFMNKNKKNKPFIQSKRNSKLKIEKILDISVLPIKPQPSPSSSFNNFMSTIKQFDKQQKKSSFNSSLFDLQQFQSKQLDKKEKTFNTSNKKKYEKDEDQGKLRNSHLPYRKYFEKKKLELSQIDLSNNYNTERKQCVQNKQNGPNIPKPFRKSLIKNKKIDVPDIPLLFIPNYFRAPTENGFGILHIHNQEVYRGMWKNNLFQGRGKLKGDGWIYQGQFKKGQIQGFGMLMFENYKIIGRFQANFIEGEGSLVCPGDITMSGIWHKSKLTKII